MAEPRNTVVAKRRFNRLFILYISSLTGNFIPNNTVGFLSLYAFPLVNLNTESYRYVNAQAESLERTREGRVDLC